MTTASDANGSNDELKISAIIFAIFGALVLAVFFVANYFMGPEYVRIFTDFKIDLPMPTRVTFQIINHAVLITVILSFVYVALILLRKWRALMFFVTFMSVTLVVEALFMYLMFMKIQEAARKR